VTEESQDGCKNRLNLDGISDERKADKAAGRHINTGVSELRICDKKFCD